MAANPKGPIDWGSRRERFRAYMKAFNPTAPPLEPFESGFVNADLHDSLFERIAARAEIEPSSQQVVLGGIGSGKTTELLLTHQRLRTQGLQAIYMEASRYTNLAEAEPGSLVAILGLELIGLSKGKDDVQPAAQEIRKYANGRRGLSTSLPSFSAISAIMESFHEASAPREIFIPGKLKSPIPTGIRDIQNIRAPLEKLLEAVRVGGDVVAIFDGMDRLPNGSRFWEVGSADLFVLRELAVPTVMVAPWPMLYDVSPTLEERFDKVYELKVEIYNKLQPKLKAILLKRDAVKLLNPDDAEKICDASGGIIRDLITIARDAGEEAYVADADVIGEAEIKNAVHNLGKSYRRGLSGAQVAILRNWNEGESFDPKRPEILELLTTRRLLEQSAGKYRVHPALASLLQ